MPHASRPFPRRCGAALLAVTWSGCLATQDAFVRIPVVIDDNQTGGLATVRIAVSRLRAAIKEFDPDQTTYYSRGRQSIPHEYEDTDGDGTPDFVIVKIPTTGTEHWVIAITRR